MEERSGTESREGEDLKKGCLAALIKVTEMLRHIKVNSVFSATAEFTVLFPVLDQVPEKTQISTDNRSNFWSGLTARQIPLLSNERRAGWTS